MIPVPVRATTAVRPAVAAGVGCSSPPTLHIAGPGVVGRALLRALAGQVDAGRVRILAVSDRSGTAFDPAGLDPLDVAAAKDAEPGLAASGAPFVDWDGATAAAEVPADIVVDLTNGPPPGHPPASPLLAALRAGKDVVTAEKTVLARHPGQVRDLLAATGARLRCGATVGGSVPVLDALTRGLRGAGVREILGAWSATTTFILSRIEAGVGFDQAVADARRAGYAEADVSVDLDGHDAAAKAAIVAQQAFGLDLTPADVVRKGVGAADIAQARQAGEMAHKLRVVARVTAEGAEVGPALLPDDHPLAVDGADAAVLIRTDLAGDHVLRGPGAGGDATAAAVLADILSLLDR
jgi:homoserine dehydrogenase